MTARLITAVVPALLLAGCANITPRGEPPTWSGTARRSLNDTTTCVITALNGRDRAVTHSAQIIDPDRVFEITPQQTLIAAGEVYFVRLTATGPASTQIDLHGITGWRSRLQAVVAPCAA